MEASTREFKPRQESRADDDTRSIPISKILDGSASAETHIIPAYSSTYACLYAPKLPVVLFCFGDSTIESSRQADPLRESLRRISSLESKILQVPSVTNVTYLALENTADLLRSLSSNAKRLSIAFTAPHITIENEGTISLEWWKEEKKLSVFVGTELKAASALRSWGPNMVLQMDEVPIPSTDDLSTLLTWLNC